MAILVPAPRKECSDQSRSNIEMKYYAKISFLNSGLKRIHAEIWKTSFIDESNYDEKICEKYFFRFGSSKRWSEKNITKLFLKENFPCIFIKDVDLIKKELV
jgi:hypothetical protein